VQQAPATVEAAAAQDKVISPVAAVGAQTFKLQIFQPMAATATDYNRPVLKVVQAASQAVVVVALGITALV
jgi:hypothetical protein